MDCGTEMLEIDVHLTSDAVVVVSHDNHLLRSTGHDDHISDMRYDELPRLKESLKPDFCPGKYGLLFVHFCPGKYGLVFVHFCPGKYGLVFVPILCIHCILCLNIINFGVLIIIKVYIIIFRDLCNVFNVQYGRIFRHNLQYIVHSVVEKIYDFSSPE